MVKFAPSDSINKFLSAIINEDNKSIYNLMYNNIGISTTILTKNNRNILHLIATGEVRIEVLHIIADVFNSLGNIQNIGNICPYFLKNFNVGDANGNTPLMLAALNDNLKIIQEFCSTYTQILTNFEYSRVQIQQGFAITANKPNHQSQTPIHIAALNHNINMIRTLLSFQAKITIQDNKGNTPAHLAAQKMNVSIESTKEVIILLTNFGNDPDLANSEGRTVLDEVYLRNMSVWSRCVDNYEVRRAYTLGQLESIGGGFTHRELIRRNNRPIIIPTI